MAVYSIVLPDSTILKRVNGFKSVLIVGCGACLNDSLGFNTERPLARVVPNENTDVPDLLPLLIDDEIQRIKILLENNGISTCTDSMIPLCEISFMTEPFITNLSKLSSEAEAIISLSCSVGTLALKKQLGNVFKIIPVTKTLGIFQVSKFLDESGEYIYLDKQKSTILKFKI